MDTEHTPINYEKACEEHDQYIKTLKKLGLEVVLLEADESFPDCVFVEDTAVVCGDRAILTNTGHVSRRGEIFTRVFMSISDTGVYIHFS